jgi:predicted ribosomally synthesized peptide with SipW-like signal peptide
MQRLRDRRSRRLAALIVVGLLAGMTGGTYAAFSSTTSNNANSFGVKADYEAPTVVRSEIARTTATTGGKIKGNVAYYVYAQITDGGNPASGVNTATANVCNITTPSCASVALTSGVYTVSGLLYNYRSASTTSDVGLTAGSKTYTVTTADIAGNSSGAVSFSVIVDGSAPSGTNVQTANASGGTAGKPETGDTVTFTFSEAMDPASILALWTGASSNVVVTFANAGCAGNDTMTVTGVNLGTLCLTGNYVNGSRSFTASPMLLSGGGTVVTITLGTPAGAFNTETVAGTMAWTPVATALDVAGNACTTTAVNEVTPPADVEF